MIAPNEIATDAVIAGADTGTEFAPDAQWASVFHKVNGWMDAPPGAYFRATRDTVELVGGVHRCGSVWYASSITKRREAA
jgi:hypothetical protein